MLDVKCVFGFEYIRFRLFIMAYVIFHVKFIIVSDVNLYFHVLTP